MKILTVCMDADGGSFFGETELPMEAADFSPPSPPGYRVSPKLGTDAVCIMRTPADYVDAWHPVPQRMFVILLSGRLRLETTDGDHRIIDTGGMFINEDDSGTGHRIMEADGGPYDMAMIHLSS